MSRMSGGRGRRVGWVIAGLAIATAAVAVVWPARRPAPPVPASWAPVQVAVARSAWPEAERHLRAWLGEHPDDDKAWAVLGGVLEKVGRNAQAVEALRKIKPDSEPWAPATAFIADIALKARNAPVAEQAFRALADRDPSAEAPRKGLVYLLSLELRTAEARARLWEMYRARPTSQGLADMVQALFQAENDVRALGPDLDAFLRATPDDPWLRRARGLGHHWRGRHAEALPYLEDAARRFDHDLVGRFALAECRVALGETADPSLLGPRPETPPADAALWCVNAARLTIDEPAALVLLKQAVALNPLDREAQFRLGQTLARRNDPSSAKYLKRAESLLQNMRALRKGLAEARRDGFSAKVCENLGNLSRDAGLLGEARAWFGLVAPNEPNFPGVLAGLASLKGSEGSDPVETLPIALARPTLRASPAPLTAALTARARPSAGVRFEDVAGKVGLTVSYDPAAQGDLFIADTMGGGVGLIDFDGDGRLDVYLVNGCPLPVDSRKPSGPNRLFRNRPDGTFEDVTSAADVGGVGYGMGCAVGDYDGDGRDDLFVTGFGHTVLYRNKGGGAFEDVTARAGVSSDRWTTAAGFGDLDGDGDLDLVAVTYVEADPRKAVPCRDNAGGAIHCSPGYYPAQADHLFRNNGDGTFTDVAASAGLDLPNGRGLGLAVADLDADGELDLFVANDASPNFYFRNLGGLKFEEIGLAAGLACDGSGRATASMGVAADDLDGDGFIDIFHTNFLNEPNTLKLNDGRGGFTDATLSAGLDAPSRATTGFGVSTLDADNDGTPDLFVANGHVDDQPWVNSPVAQPPQFYRGAGRGRFTLSGPEVSPYFARTLVGRGVAAGDLDNDGRVDLVVVHRDAPLALLRNTTDSAGHWLGLTLRGRGPARTPVGARVICKAGGRTLTRWVTSGTGYLSAADPRLHFGLGVAKTLESLEVRWPSGLTQRWRDVAADVYFVIEEGFDPKPFAPSPPGEKSP